MSLTASALKKTRVTSVFITAMIIAGIAAYDDMPRQMDPGFTIRVAQIVTFFPGASPDRVEQLITDPIERVVQEIPELDYVSSTSRVGASVVMVNISDQYTDMQPIWDDLRRKVDSIRGDLPDGIVGPDVNDEFGDVYAQIFTLTTDGYSYREMKDIADDVRDELLRLDDVAKVDILGAQDERVFVEYNNARLARLGLSAGALRELLAQRNIIMPGGDIDIGRENLAIEPSGNFQSVEDLRQTLIQLPNDGGLVYLGDIVEVRRGYVDPPRSIVHFDGDQGLALAIAMRDGGNLITLGGNVEAFFTGLAELYPHGVDFEETYFQPRSVQQKVDEFGSNVLQAIAIVLAVMLLTLGFRTGFVVASLIPASMIITLLVMSLVGISIDQMSLAALIIALGLLVDNAIVVSESILVRMGEGATAFEAGVASAKELQVPLLTSSLTTSAAFLTIFLAESKVGEYTGVLFPVVTITLLTSWILALTMTPLLCKWFIAAPKPAAAGAYEGRFYLAYRQGLMAVLRFRWVSLLVLVVAFVGGMQLFGLVPQIFFPPMKSPIFLAAFKLAPGTSIGATQAMVTDLERFMTEELQVDDERERGISHWTSFVGGTPPRFYLGYGPTPPRSHTSEFVVRTSDAEVVPDMMDRLERYAIEHHPDVETRIRPLANGPPADNPIQIRISGRDTDRLFEIVESVKARLGENPGVRNIGDDWGARVKKLVVEISEDRARRAGVTNQDIAISLQTALSGFETSQYREHDLVIPILMRSAASERESIDELATLNVFSQQSGRSVPLGQVAEIRLEWQAAEVLRRDRLRTVTIQAGITPDATAISIIQSIDPWMQEQTAAWGLGYRFEYGGEMEQSVKANSSIADKLPIAGLFIFMLLIWQFNSLRKTAIVLLTIPLALIGVGIGLVVMKSYFGFMTLLGVVSLAGIVINNAIVLLERMQLEEEVSGLSRQRAIVAAAQTRLRPILLTTATTVASLIPLYLGGGVMWEPMAVAIMFGLVFATALTLGFVPLCYSLFFRASFADFDYERGDGLPEDSPAE